MSTTDKTFVNNNPPEVEDNDYNGFALEPNNAIEASSQTLSILDREQLSKALSAFASRGDFYEEDPSTAVSAIVIRPIAPQLAVPLLLDGMRFRWIPTQIGGGVATFEILGLTGPIPITYVDGSTPDASDIYFRVGKPAEVFYKQSTNTFILSPPLESDFGVIFKRYRIGPWNMDTTSNVVLNIDLGSAADIARISVIIESDTGLVGDLGTTLTSATGAVNGGYQYNTSTNDLTLWRVTGGHFDSADYDGGGNRGWVTVQFSTVFN